MSSEQNKALVGRFLARINNKDNDGILDECFTPTYRRYLTPTTPPLTAEEQRERAARLRAAFPDAVATLEDIVADGDRVAYRLTIRGTHRGLFLGIPPSQKLVTVSFTAIVRIEDGKRAEEWGGLDQMDLLHQLGAVVSAPPHRTCD
jgi:predicted ester cyclase